MTEPRHIYRCTFGSRLYGTELPDSDFDIKGVFLPSADEILLCTPPKTWTAPSVEGQDNESYSLSRFLDLLAQGQTVALDMLFAPPSAWQLQDPYWYDVQRAAPVSILNKRCGAAIGYARAQAERYSLRGQRITALEAVLSVLKSWPNKTGQVQDALFSGEQVLNELGPDVRQYINTASVDEDSGVLFLDVCGKKIGLNCSVLQATRLYEKMLDEYGTRSREAQSGGADWKALYHAVRICEQTIELLETGRITFPRPNAADLVRIRKGEQAPERVYERIESGIEAIECAQRLSELPDEPDREAINKLIRNIHAEIVAP